MISNNLPKLLAAIILLLSICGCYELQEGCLDPYAANFELGADENCPAFGCCTYPAFNIEVDYFWGSDTTPVRTDTFYANELGQSFRIRRLRAYWSELQLNADNGAVLTPEDSTEMGLLIAPGDTSFQTLNDNLLLQSLTATNARPVGTLRRTGSFYQLSGRFGLAAPYSNVVPATMPLNHPLAFQEGRMYFGSDSSYAQIKLEYDLISGNDTIEKTALVLGSQAFTLQTPTSILPAQGQNFTIRIQARIDQLLSGCNLTDANLGACIENRYPDIFTIVE